jgi:hypothetical protein
MSGYRYSEYFSIDFEDKYEISYFDLEVDFYVHDGSGKKLPATIRIECLYDPLPDEVYDEPYFVAHIGRLCFDGTTSDRAAYLVLDGVMLEDLCPGLGYDLPYELDRFQVCLDIDVCKKPEGGGYFKVRVWVYQKVLVNKST